MARTADVLVAVAVGSALGGVARYLLSGAVQARSATLFPFGTLAVNLIGCLLLGFVMRLILETSEFSPGVRALLTTGFLGGFTTFSTFAWETVAEIEEGSLRRALAYIGASVVMGLMAVWAGSAVAGALLGVVRRPAA